MQKISSKNSLPLPGNR